MTEFMVENAAILIECFCIMLFITKYFSFKNEKFKWLKCTLLFSLSYLIELYDLIFHLSESVFVLLSVFMVFMFSVCFLKGKNVEKLLLSIITHILFAFINLPVLSFFNSVLGCDMESITGGTSDARIEVLIITKLLYFLITQSIVVINRKKEYVFCAAEWFMIIMTSVIVISIESSEISELVKETVRVECAVDKEKEESVDGYSAIAMYPEGGKVVSDDGDYVSLQYETGECTREIYYNVSGRYEDIISFLSKVYNQKSMEISRFYFNSGDLDAVYESGSEEEVSESIPTIGEIVKTGKIVSNSIYKAGIGIKVHMYDRSFDLVSRTDY